jgi:hypothetical protein
MDEGTKAAARALVEACNATLERESRRSRRAWERIYLTHPQKEFEDPGAYQRLMQDESAKVRTHHDEAAKTLLSDLRALVPPAHDDAWDSFERRRHRRLYLGVSYRVGLAVDLVEISENQKIDGVPAVRAVLGAYEPGLDKLLLARLPAAIDWLEHSTEAQQKNDTAACERLFTALRDEDCALLHFQRDAARRLIEAAPAEQHGQLRDLLLTGRSPYIQTKPPVRMRAERILKSNRLTGATRETLARAARTFDERSRALDDRHLRVAEDAGCAQTYAQSQQADENLDMKAWYEESRQLQAELLAVLESVASDDDLDWADRQREPQRVPAPEDPAPP